jgi:hypothetical protein
MGIVHGAPGHPATWPVFLLSPGESLITEKWGGVSSDMIQSGYYPVDAGKTAGATVIFMHHDGGLDSHRKSPPA